MYYSFYSYYIYKWSLQTLLFLYKIYKKQGEQFFLGKNSFKEIWNGWEMRNIRKKMLKNEKLPKCQHCFNEEKHTPFKNLPINYL